jgi:hypothetical protein
MKLQTKRLGKYWWITGDEEYGPYGPYNTKAEADEDRRGLARTFKYSEEPGFVTNENKI